MMLWPRVVEDRSGSGFMRGHLLSELAVAAIAEILGEARCPDLMRVESQIDSAYRLQYFTEAPAQRIS
jgi:hypothetical protein